MTSLLSYVLSTSRFKFGLKSDDKHRELVQTSINVLSGSPPTENTVDLDHLKLEISSERLKLVKAVAHFSDRNSQAKYRGL